LKKAGLNSKHRTLRAENAVVLAKTSEPDNDAVMAAIAGGVGVVDMEWVHKSRARDKVLPMERFLLQQPTDRFLLDNLRVELVGSTAFKQKWGRVLRHGGAKHVERLFSDPRHIDAVVCQVDRASPNAVVEKRADEFGISLVGTSWLVESIRAQRVLDCTEPRFKAQRLN
jgi:hypothetical protein